MAGKWYTVTDTTKYLFNQVRVPHTNTYTTADYKQFNADSTGTETLNGVVYKFRWIVYDDLFAGVITHILVRDYQPTKHWLT